jgi:uncharacterized protein (DUF362 family)
MKGEFSRRTFFEKTLLFGTGAALSSPWFILKANTAHPADLVLVKGDTAAALGRALEALGGIERFVKPSHKVVIKPNMSFSSGPELGANTDPALVAEVARRCASAGAREILVCDYPLHRPNACLKGSGIIEALKGIPSTRFQFFTENKFFEKRDVPEGKTLKKISVLKPLLEADVLINLPKAKTHGSTTVTLALKNLMGLIWERKAFHVIYDIHQAIADLATLIRPSLTILDASSAMVQGGPGGPGRLEYPRTIVAGINQLEVDALGVSLARWYGKEVTARDIPHLLNAYGLGLGEVNLNQLRYKRLQV